ncbi:4Fe-4S binding protein [Thalassotalea sp. G2M2-11]|uniref:4Fe-4S binding protein n=1 Tax=Thalassotalea sp. G2M2-11 TaxID=2787627 RepID=UPI0019D31841|nr:4Fe-4S binding protein [Thalassotalea sp. G2M2-11]
MTKQYETIDVLDITPNASTSVYSSSRLTGLEWFFHRHKDKLKWFHLAMFVLFLIILFVPLFLPEPSEQATPLDNFTVFANYLMWGLWFPLVFLSVIFTGRSWCGLLCPMGAASEWANKRGLQKQIPAFIRWEGMPIISFLLITFLGQTVGVRDHPEALAEIFGGVMLMAIIVGFIWGKKNRAWCRHICPIGLLLGLFSRLGIVQFISKKHKPGGDKYAEQSFCPTMIDLRHKQESRHCIECFRCVNPEAKSSVMVKLRKPGREVERIKSHNPGAAEVCFFLLGTGSALGGFLWLTLPIYHQMRQVVGEWFVEKGWYWIGEAGPWWLMSNHPERREVFNWLDFLSIIGFMAIVTLCFAITLSVINVVTTWLAQKAGSTDSFKHSFKELAYQYMPIAMVSLLIGLGGKLFEWLMIFGLTEANVVTIKLAVFSLSIIWSLKLGWEILAGQQIGRLARILPCLSGLFGSLFVGLCWWPAIFGL